MDSRQVTAFTRPCFVAEETAHQRFYSAERAAGRWFSVGLTVNVGLK